MLPDYSSVYNTFYAFLCALLLSLNQLIKQNGKKSKYFPYNIKTVLISSSLNDNNINSVK